MPVASGGRCGALIHRRRRAEEPGVSTRLLTVLICGLGVVMMAAHPTLVYAQAHVTLAAQQATTGTGVSDLLADPGTWATTMFNNALLKLGEKPTSDVVGCMVCLL